MVKKGDYVDRISARIHRGLGIPEREVKRLLNDDHLKGELAYLQKHGVPENVAMRAISAGISDAIKSGKELHIEPENVAYGVYMNIAASKQYRGIAQKMLEDGIIEEKDLKRIIKKTDQNLKDTSKSARVLEDLLKKAAVILLLFGGVYYMFNSFSDGITGAVVGANGYGEKVLWGVAFFMFALTISHFFLKE